MKIEYLDWSILRIPSAIFITVCLITVSIVTASYYYRQAMQQEYTASQSTFRNISSRYLQVDQEEMLIKKYYPEFLDLYKSGLIGKEKRLDWIESLQSISEVLEIPSLRYEISSQEPLPESLPIDTGRFRIYQSVMQVNMDMLHEIDLIRFLERINKVAQGLYTVSSCSLTRRTKDVDTTSEQANVSAECELDWYSIKTTEGHEIIM